MSGRDHLLRHVVPSTPMPITDHEEHLLRVSSEVGDALPPKSP